MPGRHSWCNRDRSLDLSDPNSRRIRDYTGLVYKQTNASNSKVGPSSGGLMWRPFAGYPTFAAAPPGYTSFIWPSAYSGSGSIYRYFRDRSRGWGNGSITCGETWAIDSTGGMTYSSDGAPGCISHGHLAPQYLDVFNEYTDEELIEKTVAKLDAATEPAWSLHAKYLGGLFEIVSPKARYLPTYPSPDEEDEHISGLILSDFVWRPAHPPIPTCYCKIWYREKWQPYVHGVADGAPDYTDLEPYEWLPANGFHYVDMATLLAIDSYIMGDELTVEVPTEDGIKSVELVKFSYLPDYEPGTGEPNGFPN